MRGTPYIRFVDKVHPRDDSDCWEWIGAIDRGAGYGKFGLNGKTVLAHRFSYEEHVGPIPVGLDIDHLCRNRWCVNPAHLEPVTRSENLRRSPLMGIAARRLGPRPERRRAECKRGHKMEGANVMQRGDGSRECRTCAYARGRANRLGLGIDTFMGVTV